MGVSYLYQNKKENIMDIKEIKQASIKFWDDYFKQYPTFKIQKSDITIDTVLDECLKFLGDQCENVIDIGCGEGLCLMEIALIGDKVKSCLGVDAAETAVSKASEIATTSEIKNIKFVQGDENYLKSLPDSSFDGIFCSNFLDVVPASISEVVIKEILRIIKPKGFILLKFNFVLNPELIEKLHMVEIEKNTYTMNGVVRAMNRSTEEWVSLFIDCDVVRIGEFARAPGLPNDRVILLQKK